MINNVHKELLNCSRNDDNFYIYCLNDFINKVYKSDFHCSERSVRSASQTIKMGGCCKDWTVVYSVFLKKKGIYFSQINVNNHIFVIAETQNVFVINSKKEVFPTYYYLDIKRLKLL